MTRSHGMTIFAFWVGMLMIFIAKSGYPDPGMTHFGMHALADQEICCP